MATLILFNKPFDVLCQFTAQPGSKCLADYLDIRNVYPAGRLDRDSEGLLLLTDEGRLQAQIAEPRFKMPKTYQVQVEGEISIQALALLSRGLELNDGLTRPARVKVIPEPALWPRSPPVRERHSIPTSWLEITIKEGRNRQVRRMLAATGFPVLRLVRQQIGDWSLSGLQPGEYKTLSIHLPVQQAAKNNGRTTTLRRAKKPGHSTKQRRDGN